jgi:hypothetical protein
VYPALKGQLIPLSERGHVGEGWLGSSCALLPWVVRVSLSASHLLISFHPHRQLWRQKVKKGPDRLVHLDLELRCALNKRDYLYCHAPAWVFLVVAFVLLCTQAGS